MTDALQTPVSITRETSFSGPFSVDQLWWIGAGLLVVLALLTIRDFVFARKKWVVPALFLLRSMAFAGVLVVLAGPVDLTRKTFESGKNSLGIFLDTSASMRLQDLNDGQGSLTRWELATKPIPGGQSLLTALDQSLARIEAALSLAGEDADSRKLLFDQLHLARELFSAEAARLPFPSLVTEISARLDTVVNSAKDSPKPLLDLRQEVSDITKRIAVISRELARREEQESVPEAPLTGLETRSTTSPSRLQWAGSLLARIEKEVLPKLQEDLSVLRYQFSETVKPISDTAWLGPDLSLQTQQTHLNQLLQQIADQHSRGEINAAIVLTDAVPNQPGGEQPRVPASLADFPLFLVPTGTEYQFSDTTLWSATAPETVVENDFMSVECLVGATGFSGKTTRLILKKEGRELDSAEVTFAENADDQKVRLSTRVTSPGTHRFEVVLEPLSGELMPDNNREFMEVKVVTGNLNILLVDGWPRWETRYLSNLLKRDSGITHRELLVGTAPKTEWSAEVLSSSQKLGVHQVVLLGEVGPEFIGPTEMAALETYVNQGGNLIVMAGAELMPAAFQKSVIADLLPVDLNQQRPGGSSGYYLAPTGVGKGIAALNLEDSRTKNDAVWRLGSSRLLQDDLSPFNIPKPGAQTIVEALSADGKSDAALPYIVWHRYGSGRVFYFSSPTTYYLRYRFGDRYHYRFWGQFFRWVTVAEINRRGAFVSISTDQKRYQENDRPGVEVEIQDTTGEPLRGGNVKVRLVPKNGAPSEHLCAELSGKAGVYQASLPPLAPGEYQIEPIGPEVEKLQAEIARAPRPGGEEAAFVAGKISFFVEPRPNLEDGDRACDWETARQLVLSTRGALLAPAALGSAIEILAQKQVKTAREEVTQIPLWDRWPVFFLILFFLVAEWAGRKFAGLL